MKTKNIIFVHGVTSFGKSHIVLERNLTRQGYKFHSFDLPGHGSRTSEWKTHAYKFNDMVNCVKEYINKKLKNEKFIILGHSMGGGITQVICKMFKKQITGVILECPYNQGATLAAYESNFKKLIKNKATTAALKKEINADLKKYETVNKNAPKSDPFAAWKGYEMYFPLLKDLAKPQTFIKVKEACKTISVPTLLINGELDPVIAPYATIGMLKTLINKKYFNNTIIKGAKHNPFKDTPEAYNDVIKAYLTKFN